MVAKQLLGLFLLGLFAATMASQPITLSNVLDVLSTEGLQQYKLLSLQQQEAAIIELAALAINLQDAKSVRFSSKGKVRYATGWLLACLGLPL